MWGMGIFLVIERLTPCGAQIYNMVDIGYYLADTVSHFLTPTHISLHFFCGFVWFCLILRPLTSLRASVVRQQERNKDGRIHRQRRLLMLWIWRYRILAKFKLIVKNKAMSMPHWVYYIQPSLCPIIYLAGRGSTIYLHQRGANGVARFDNQGNARSLIAWNEWQDAAPRFCDCM